MNKQELLAKIQALLQNIEGELHLGAKPGSPNREAFETFLKKLKTAQYSNDLLKILLPSLTTLNPYQLSVFKSLVLAYRAFMAIDYSLQQLNEPLITENSEKIAAEVEQLSEAIKRNYSINALQSAPTEMTAESFSKVSQASIKLFLEPFDKLLAEMTIKQNQQIAAEQAAQAALAEKKLAKAQRKAAKLTAARLAQEEAAAAQKIAAEEEQANRVRELAIANQPAEEEMKAEISSPVRSSQQIIEEAEKGAEAKLAHNLKIAAKAVSDAQSSEEFDSTSAAFKIAKSALFHYRHRNDPKPLPKAPEPVKTESLINELYTMLVNALTDKDALSFWNKQISIGGTDTLYSGENYTLPKNISEMICKIADGNNSDHLSFLTTAIELSAKQTKNTGFFTNLMRKDTTSHFYSALAGMKNTIGKLKTQQPLSETDKQEVKAEIEKFKTSLASISPTLIGVSKPASTMDYETRQVYYKRHL
jgi:hypothetical protein